MPEKRTIDWAKRARRSGKAPSTQANEFVREQIDNVRRGKHGARSAAQAIAIGLSEARKAGVDLPPPKKGKVKESTRKSAKYAYDVGQGKRKPKRQPRVARAVSEVMKKEPRDTVSRAALSRQTKRAAARRTASERSAAAKKAARTRASKPRSQPTRKPKQKRS